MSYTKDNFPIKVLGVAADGKIRVRREKGRHEDFYRRGVDKDNPGRVHIDGWKHFGDGDYDSAGGASIPRLKCEPHLMTMARGIAEFYSFYEFPLPPTEVYELLNSAPIVGSLSELNHP